MWKRLKRAYPLIYEIVEWSGLVLAAAVFVLSLALYFR